MSLVLFRGISRQCLSTARASTYHTSPTLSQAFAVTQLQNHKTTTLQSNASSKLLQKFPTTQWTALRCSSDGDHVRMWTAERVLSVVLLGVIPAAIAMPTPAMETVLALTLTVHSHWGIEALVHDYIRPSMFGKTIPVVAAGLVLGLSITTFGTLCYFIHSDVGIINAVDMLWRL